MEAAFVHQGTGHDPVVHEVAGDEPVIGVNVRLGANQTLAVASSLGQKFHDPVHEVHQPTRNGQGAFQVEIAEGRAETARQVALA